ncbi:MAG TPA: hypothetical protein DCY40_08935 [Actinobacteria bacterium]|nr:hypothetical protein [Actinomycetota bacterium]
MGCHGWHSCGPGWGPHFYQYERGVEPYPTPRRRHTRDVEGDLREYMQFLEGEVAEVHRELDELVTRRAGSE